MQMMCIIATPRLLQRLELIRSFLVQVKRMPFAFHQDKRRALPADRSFAKYVVKRFLRVSSLRGYFHMIGCQRTLIGWLHN